MVGSIPNKRDPFTLQPNPQYPSEMRLLRQRLQQAGGLVVWLDGVTWRDYLPTESEVQGALGLRRLVAAGDGAIYSVEDVAPDAAVGPDD